MQKYMPVYLMVFANTNNVQSLGSVLPYKVVRHYGKSVSMIMVFS